MANRLFALKLSALVGVATAALIPSLATAQVNDGQNDPQTRAIDQQAAGGIANISSEQPAGDEIVVTGTLIRGVAPVGSSVIAAGRDKLESSGASTSNELLARIPQVSNLFGSDPSRNYGIAVNNIQIVRPNLRNITPSSASSSATLVLFDGHRVAAAGVTQASVDPDLLPTSAIERVEVVTDGGSAIYGADAVGGVINFITRKRFDGVKVDARYGFADSYWHMDANAIAGKDWGTGSAYVAYTYNRNSALYGRDRSFINNYVYDANGNINTTTNPPLGFSGRACVQPNITTGGVAYTLSGGAFSPGTTFCDGSDNDAVIPDVKRHGVLASLTQELNDSLSIDVRAFYSQRDTVGRGVRTITNAAITNTNAFYQQIGPVIGGSQQATLSFEPALGNKLPLSGTSIKEWGVSAELKADVTENWQFRGLFNYSNTNSSFYINEGTNAANLNIARVSNNPSLALNPYNVALTNPTVLAGILDNQSAAQTKNQLLDLRGIVEGRLIALPGGDVRLAVGYEYQHDVTQTRNTTSGVAGLVSSRPFSNYTRQVHAVFGELQIPVFGPDNAVPGIQSFVISAQGRYDHYSDFGGTFNPKIGATYKPVEWLSLRGNWSRSFNAPSSLDQLGANATVGAFGGGTISLFSLENSNDTNTLLANGASVIAIRGAKANLRPQTAKIWSVGFDVEPPFIPGLRASMSYYKVVFSNTLSTPSPFNGGIFAAFPTITLVNGVTGLDPVVVAALVNAVIPNISTTPGPVMDALTCNSGTVPCLAAGSLVYGFIDFRTGNYGTTRAAGLDWSVNYSTNTSFGKLDAAFNGNLQLTRQRQLSPGTPFLNDLEREEGGSDLRMQGVLGANVGEHIRAQGTVSYLSGNGRLRTPGNFDTRIGSFTTFDLFLKYDFKGEQIMRDLSLTLNVNNLFNEKPPLLRTGSGFENGRGSLIGRDIILGVSKKF